MGAMRNNNQLKQQAVEQAFEALKTVLNMMEQQPELKEIDAEFPRGSVFGIVRAAYENAQMAGVYR